MSNRKLLLTFFIFGLGLFFLGVGTGKRLENPPSEILGEKSISQTSAPTAEPVQSSVAQKTSYKVLKVIDGDTIDIQINEKKETVRLIGINAPETNECFGKEAGERARELLDLKSVSLEADPSQGERDKYRRILRYVFVNGTSFEEIMIREGFAKEYTYRTAYKYQSLFKEAQKEAIEQKRGLWADGACEDNSKVKIQNSKLIPSSSSTGNFTCDCSKLCSQIATCDEAYYQLNSCGCSERDSDRDGIPCESLCR